MLPSSNSSSAAAADGRPITPLIHQPVENTPTKPRYIFSAQGSFGNLYEARYANLKDIGRDVSLLPLDAVLSSVLPPVPPGHVDSVFDMLKLVKFLDEGTGYWSGFGGDPKTHKEHEGVVFKRI